MKMITRLRMACLVVSMIELVADSDQVHVIRSNHVSAYVRLRYF